MTILFVSKKKKKKRIERKNRKKERKIRKKERRKILLHPPLKSRIICIVHYQSRSNRSFPLQRENKKKI